MISSFHSTAPGSFTRVAPMCWPACQSPTAAPPGSSTKAIRPASITSKAGMAIWPPAAATLATASSTESTAM